MNVSSSSTKLHLSGGEPPGSINTGVSIPSKDNPNSLKYPISSSHLTNEVTMKISVLTIFATFFALAVAGPVPGFAKRHRNPFWFPTNAKNF